MKQYQNYIQGNWVSGDGSETKLFNAINGDLIGEVSSKGIDYKSVLEYGRSLVVLHPKKNDAPRRRLQKRWLLSIRKKNRKPTRVSC